METNNQKTIKKAVEEDVRKNDATQIASLTEAENDPSVKEALIKEKSPDTPDDLSHLHDTVAIGTSGGDQRASENELKGDQ